ncbi:putative methyltransferase [Chitinispirillum alkaliphilum]|nr:putative methyltransferase [Chitinispirillum alkaliphilum]
MAAGRIAGINPSSNILVLDSGFGEGVCTLASEFRCKISAFDSCKTKNKEAHSLAINKGVSHLVSLNGDFFTTELEPGTFELAILEKSALSSKKRSVLLARVQELLQMRGWLAFSVPIKLADSVPNKILSCFEDGGGKIEKEEFYRSLIENSGFDIHFTGLVPQSGWDNYFSHLACHLGDEKGYYADALMKIRSHQQIDAFYRLEASRYIGYLFCIARKI